MNPLLPSETAFGLSTIVLFTYATPMSIWKSSGLLDREIGYYRMMEQEGKGMYSFLTYSFTDKQYEPEIAPFKILPKICFKDNLVFGLSAPLLYYREFRNAHVYRTNQINGSWVGLIAKLLKPSAKYVVRCGYVPTREMMARAWNYDETGIRWSELLQRITYRMANLIIVTTPSDKEYLCKIFHIKPDKILIIPNAVDVELFQTPQTSRSWDSPIQIIAVGRQVKMKNFQGLIEAVHELTNVATLTLVGNGSYRSTLERLAQQCSVPVRFLGSLPNNELPGHFTDSHIFVMPQEFGSGMSKAIIEAMSCGLVVVASDIQAHREVIRHGENGFLCGTTPRSIRHCLQEVMALPPAKLEAVSKQAVQDICDRYSMQANARQEIKAIADLFKS